MFVLIVEDQIAMRSALRELLHSIIRNWQSWKPALVALAMARCHRYRPRLILMDIKLPDANGIELTAQIKDRLPGTAVIVVSQHSGQTNANRALAAGALGFVRKDTTYIKLLPMIAQAFHVGAS